MVCLIVIAGACSAGPARIATPAASVGVPGGVPVSTFPNASGVPPGAAILAGAGDIASCDSSGDEATATLLDRIDGTVFTAGDNAYDNGSARDFAECYTPTWGRFLDRTLPLPGNHDYNIAGASGYFAYFGAAAGDPSQGWYARDVGAWRIYALNSNCGAIGGCAAGSPQERWLRADLTANPRACVLAIWHHPLFSSGEHGSNDATVALWRALSDARAEVVVNGHDHDYERFAPQTAAGAPDPNGLVEYVAGMGGRSHYVIAHTIANSLARSDDTYGILRFELYGGSWASAFVPVAGSSFRDDAAGTCH